MICYRDFQQEPANTKSLNLYKVRIYDVIGQFLKGFPLVAQHV